MSTSGSWRWEQVESNRSSNISPCRLRSKDSIWAFFLFFFFLQPFSCFITAPTTKTVTCNLKENPTWEGSYFSSVTHSSPSSQVTSNLTLQTRPTSWPNPFDSHRLNQVPQGDQVTWSIFVCSLFKSKVKHFSHLHLSWALCTKNTKKPYTFFGK